MNNINIYKEVSFGIQEGKAKTEVQSDPYHFSTDEQRNLKGIL
jgi:hypothetical protein